METVYAPPLRRPAAGRALQCVGVGTAELADRRMTVGGSRFVGMPFGKLTALVRTVDARLWEAESLLKLRADKWWLAAQADLHEHVLDRAMAYGSIVPMPLLTVFPDLHVLREEMRRQSARWYRTLSRLGGKREWSVMLFTGPHSVPSNDPYTFRVRPLGPRSRFAVTGGDADRTRHAQELWKQGLDLAENARQLVSPGRQGFLFGASFLLTEGGIEPFRKAVMKLAQSALELGVSTYFEGPRPPFTFI